MALLTMIARVIDGLPLVGTMQDDEQVRVPIRCKTKFPGINPKKCYPLQSGRSIVEYQNQAKMLFRKLGSHSPARCSIETGPYLFQ